MTKTKPLDAVAQALSEHDFTVMARAASEALLMSMLADAPPDVAGWLDVWFHQNIDLQEEAK
jgi:hypothetical protein